LFQPPPFRADHVGSLLRPAALLDLRRRVARGEATPAALADLMQDAIAFKYMPKALTQAQLDELLQFPGKK
jgi:methionine synthase II (cobalamin-independent)